MNGRERFLRTMHHQSVDRAPMIEVGYWAEAQERWLREGMPEEARRKDTLTFNGCAFFGLDEQRDLGLNLGMIPSFEPELLVEDERTITRRNGEGVVQRCMKDGVSMPQYVAWPVTERADFERIKRRYDPHQPERYPADWDELVAWAPQRECPLWGPGIGSVGFYSMLRRWMGTENACTVFYDDPALAEEMLDVVAEFTLGAMARTLEQVQLDYFLWWEDFAFKNGPLISPAIFQRFLLPRYRRVNDVFRRHGIDIIFLDSDGDPSVLLPMLLEAGVNGTYPIEAAAGMDPVALRREYGRDLLLWGGVDKRALTKDRRTITEELESKLPPLLADGGYIPQLDHLAPPDISYENWLFYLDLKRRLLERG
ncbi:MAG TPA: uroporphyrinogen decarboxylase family protein [Armatimonadota bacterium]|nr:uroporphyrinogen decarboxylase family protein [Armatimonadota bacterium]